MGIIDDAKRVNRDRGIYGVVAGVWIYILQHSLIAYYLECLLGEIRHEQLIAFLEVGYWPNIINPKSFNEKIMHRKICTDKDHFSTVSDKWAVRDYIKEKTREEILTDVYYVTDDPEAIPFHSFPDQYVVKATHGSSMNIFIRDNEKSNLKEIKSQCQQWLSEEYGSDTREYWYTEISPKIIVEEYIEADDKGVPLDYKFFVFNGYVEYIQVDVGRFSQHQRRFYNRNWEPQEFSFKYPLCSGINEPYNLNEMINVAESIAGDFSFARVDLYNPHKDVIRFGEITLAPESGQGRFQPKQSDFDLGKLWPDW